MNVEQQRSELKRWRDAFADSSDCPLKENLKVSNKRYIEDHFPDEELGMANTVMKLVVTAVTESIRADTAEATVSNLHRTIFNTPLPPLSGNLLRLMGLPYRKLISESLLWWVRG